jgi:hypothetical protein
VSEFATVSEQITMVTLPAASRTFLMASDVVMLLTHGANQDAGVEN